MFEWFGRHWRLFWRSGPENLYTYVWWAIMTAGIGAVVVAAGWVWGRFRHLDPTWNDRFLTALVVLITVCVLAWIAASVAKRYGRNSGLTNDRIGKPTAVLGPVPQVFVGRMWVDFQRLKKEGYILFQVNLVCCAMDMRLENAVSGAIYYRESPTSERIELDTPQLDQSFSGFNIWRGGGFPMTIKQHLSPSIVVRDGECADKAGL